MVGEPATVAGGKNARLRRRWRATVLSLLALSTAHGGCSRQEGAVVLTAAFNSATEIGRVTVVWEATTERRDFAQAVRLKQPEALVRYRLDVENNLRDQVYLQLRNLRFVDERGLELAAASEEATSGCRLGPGDTEGVERGSLWMAASAVPDIRGYRVDSFAVPLSERGRALYREWLLQSGEKDADAQIVRLISAPPCR